MRGPVVVLCVGAALALEVGCAGRALPIAASEEPRPRPAATGGGAAKILRRKVTVSYVDADLPDAEDVTVGEVLRKLAETGRLDYECRDGMAVFWSERNHRLAWKLNAAELWFKLEEIPFEDGIRFARTFIDADVILDTKPQRLGPPITLEVYGLWAGATLGWLLKLAGLDYEIWDGKILISSPEHMDSFVLSTMPGGQWRGEVVPRRRAASSQELARIRRSLSSSDYQARKRAAYSLASVKGEHCRPLLEAAASNADEWVRMPAFSALALLDGPENPASLAKALADPHAKVRRMAVTTLGRAARGKAFPLVKGALDDKDPGVRSAAARALGRLGGEEAFPLLERAMRDPKEGVRASAARGLGDLGGERALRALERALADSSVHVRSQAVEALGDVGGERALTLLERAMSTRQEAIRWSLGYAIGVICNEKALSLFRRAVES
ncbi:MAG: HEAT repeat domain-containing protein, partial [Planctomycetota bacterium]